MWVVGKGVVCELLLLQLLLLIVERKMYRLQWVNQSVVQILMIHM